MTFPTLPSDPHPSGSLPSDPLPSDYEERVYAGVLGKLVGVYLGRPFEGWSHERILDELGEIDTYVNDRFGIPLVLTDDDVTGTFTFLRALEDHGRRRDLTAREIGRSWLNYIVEKRTILWWGGNGNSTEHTAWLNLRRGVEAPASGSAETNGPLVAEQIGAQIFIDGWGMVAPGDPALAARLAGEAARVSHDGVAVHAAQLLAAMEAQAFVERSVDALLDTGLGVIPADSLIARLIADVRTWHAADGDWYATRARIAERYGYHRYGGNCHVVPNHAIIVLSLLYGGDDLQRALRIANTSGWDTDCNSGNVGCLMGIKEGLAGLERGPDWRGPVADRLYLPTADGGRAITDAVTETRHVVRMACALHDLPPPPAPKGGARFHFELPGSVQGWQPRPGPDTVARARAENARGGSRDGARSLALRFEGVARGRCARFATPTFIPPEAIDMPGNYDLLASPTLHPGQMVAARLEVASETTRSVEVRLFVGLYDGDDALVRRYGPAAELEPGGDAELEWKVPDEDGLPIALVGVEVRSEARADGTVHLDRLGWTGAPDTSFVRPPGSGRLWRRAWVQALDHAGHHWPSAYHLSQDRGRGLLIRGGRDWHDYRVAVTISSEVAPTVGVCARVQGLERYYALVLRAGGTAALIKRRHGDRVLAEAPFAWERATDYALALEVDGNRLRASIDGEPTFDVIDEDDPFLAGGVALLVEEGLLMTQSVRLKPLASS